MKIKNEIQLFFQDIKDLFCDVYKYIQKNFNLTYFIIAVIHFIVTFYTDNLIFQYKTVFYTDILNFEYKYPNFISIEIIKTIFFIMLIFMWQFIGIIIKKYSTSPSIRDFIKFSAIYFFIMMLFQLALWPFIIGDQMYYMYFSDSIYFLDSGYFSYMSCFQGLFIKYFRIYALMLIPNIAGIMILQLLTISLILGYIMAKVKSYFKLGKLIYFFYIPFLMPIVIQYNLLMEKDILYSYFSMLLVAKLIFVQLESKSYPININLFNIALISSIVASLRSEGILFLVATPLVLYLFNYKILKLRNMILFLLLSIFCSFIFMPHYVSSVILDKDGEGYKNVYILNDSLKILLKKAVDDKNRYILDEFNNTYELKIEHILNKNINNVGFFRVLTDEDKQQFKLISKKLMIVYFGEYVKFKFNAFYNGLGTEYLKINLHDMNDIESFAIPAYNSIKDKIIYLSPYIYSETIKLFQRYREFPFVNFLSVKFIILYSFIFLGAILMKLKRILILTYLLIIFFIIQILIIPYPGFRFLFLYYLVCWLLIFYLIFYFINAKKYKTE